MTTLATVATDLRAIEDMAARLEARAVDRSNAREIPGGEALVALAPVGSVRVWAQRVDALEQRWSADPNVRIEDMPNWAEAEDPDELWPALQVLWWWTEDYRARLGMDYDDPRWRPTLTSEAAFLRNHDVAEWVWAHEVKYDDYAGDVARAKVKLENILREGERSDRTPVVCDRCDDGRPLILVRADSPPVEWICMTCQATATAPLEECPRCGMDLPLEAWRWPDLWKCQGAGCKHLFDDVELRAALAKQLRSESAERFVPLPDAIDTLRAQGRAERTIRKWLAPPIEHVKDECTECGKRLEPQEYAACPVEMDDDQTCGGLLRAVYQGDRDAVIEGYCDLSTHKVWVWWPSLWRLHLITQTRKRASAA